MPRSCCPSIGPGIGGTAAFDPTDLQVDLAGRVCLVTGANSGIGFETSLALAARGGRVLMQCRHRQRALTAVRDVRARTGLRRVHLGLIDVSDTASIRRFVRSLKAPVVDVIVHNAGVFPDERTESVDGHELTFATHVLKPWLLTTLLLPRRRTGRATLASCSSPRAACTRKLSRCVTGSGAIAPMTVSSPTRRPSG